MGDLHSDRRIVVGVDGSDSSQRALRWAAGEAVRRGVGLDVVHAWMTPYPLSVGEVFGDPAPFEATGRALLDRAVASVASGGQSPGDVRLVLLQDHPSKALLHAAAGAGLLVVGSRGRGGFRGLLLGSVSRHCVHRPPCPVVVVPPNWERDEHARVAVGVDGSPASMHALQWAIAEAAERGAGLDVVNALDVGEVELPGELLLGSDRGDLEAASRTMLGEMVSAALASAPRRPTEVELLPVHLGAAAALLGHAEHADLLVVGSRGRGAVGEMLLGSVSQQCIHHAPCPVAVVPPASAPVEAAATPSDPVSANELH